MTRKEEMAKAQALLGCKVIFLGGSPVLVADQHHRKDGLMDEERDIDDLWGAKGDPLGANPWDIDSKEYNEPTVEITLEEWEYLDSMLASVTGYGGRLDEENEGVWHAWLKWGGYTKPAYFKEWDDRMARFLARYPEHDRP